LKKEIREFCRGKIAGFKIPKRIEFITDEEMPRTGTGKILHRKLQGLLRKIKRRIERVLHKVMVG